MNLIETFLTGAVLEMQDRLFAENDCESTAFETIVKNTHLIEMGDRYLQQLGVMP